MRARSDAELAHRGLSQEWAGGFREGVKLDPAPAAAAGYRVQRRSMAGSTTGELWWPRPPPGCPKVSPDQAWWACPRRATEVTQICRYAAGA